MKTGKYLAILLVLVGIIIALSFDNKTEEVYYGHIDGSDDTELGIYKFNVYKIYLSVENMYSINLNEVMGYNIVNEVTRINERRKSNNF